MKPEEVKLTLKDEARVMFNFLYHSFPWRYIIFIGGGALIGPFVHNCGCGGVAIGGAIAVGCGALAGLISALILFNVIPWIWDEILDVYRPKYLEHRAKAQKQALDNVDNQILK